MQNSTPQDARAQSKPINLIKAGIIALLVAAIALIGFILPAEYNIDPTGFGKAMGLTQLNEEGRVAEQQATQEQVDQALAKASDSEFEYRSDKIEIKVASGKGLEYKFELEEYGRITYSWSTGGEPIYFDFHGEPKGDTSGFFESFSLSTASSAEGTLTTPFAGSHGWYWKNKTDNEILITLKTKGFYRVIGYK